MGRIDEYLAIDLDRSYRYRLMEHRERVILALSRSLCRHNRRLERSVRTYVRSIEQIAVVVQHVYVHEHYPDLLPRLDAQLLKVDCVAFPDASVDDSSDLDRFLVRGTA